MPIFKAPISGTHSTSAAHGIAVRNFPNPFRGFTTIAFTLPQSGRVVIDVLDQHGQLLDTAADRHFESGEHQVTHRNTQLSAGQYVYRLRMGETAVSRQMLVF